MLTCNFHCTDVIPLKYFQAVDVNFARIRMMLISEAVPQNIADYFDGEGIPAFIQNTNTLFNACGYPFQTYQDYLQHGIYLTTAIKCAKQDYLVAAETIQQCSLHLEKEIDQFSNLRLVMLMGDFAIKSINYLARRRHQPRIIPAGSTYKLRDGVYECNGVRYFPSYTQTGASFGIEKSKVMMMQQDIKRAMSWLENQSEETV